MFFNVIYVYFCTPGGLANALVEPHGDLVNVAHLDRLFDCMDNLLP